MRVIFEQSDQQDIEVVVKAASLTPEVQRIIAQLGELTPTLSTLPITVGDRVELVNVADIVLIEVYGSQLTVQTVTTSFSFHGQLKAILARLHHPDFVQVAKGTVVNCNHLLALEAGFSGSMTALLTNEAHVTVSRKFLPALKRQLGM